MKQKGTTVKAGDVVPYLFCLGPDGKTAKSAQADRAYHPDEFRKPDSELKLGKLWFGHGLEPRLTRVVNPDFDFYLTQQVLPPIERLCNDIEGTDRARLAECLGKSIQISLRTRLTISVPIGLDPTRFQNNSNSAFQEKEIFTFSSQISDKERFRDADPLTLRCRACKSVFVFNPIVEDMESVSRISVDCHVTMLIAFLRTDRQHPKRRHQLYLRSNTKHWLCVCPSRAATQGSHFQVLRSRSLLQRLRGKDTKHERLRQTMRFSSKLSGRNACSGKNGLSMV